MLFHVFHSQSDRWRFGSSALIELQFCKLPFGMKAEELVDVDRINHWQNDSLYVNEVDLFFQEYSHIFPYGTYNNLQSGVVDIYGINYYAPSFTNSIIEKLREEEPTDYEILVEWLDKSKPYNGFYILGI